MNDAPSSEIGSSPVDPNLFKKTQRATRLTMIGQIAGQVISLIVLAEMYRLVDPVEFGLLGMFMPILLLVRSFGSLGMDIATVQKRNLTDEQSSTLFWYQVITGVILVVVLAGLSPLLSYWFHAERLLPVGIALSGTALLYNSYSQHKSLAEKKLRFGRLTIVRLLSLVISGGLGIVAAWFDYGVWALVIQQYAELIVLNIGFWAIEPWRPGRRAHFSEVRNLLQFSGFYTLSGLFFAFGQNLDKILLGVLMGGTNVGHEWIGYYTQAYNQMIRPVYLLTSPVTAAMLPALSHARGNTEVFTRLTGNFYRMVGIMLAPCSIGMFLVGERLMPVLGGDEWIESGELLAVMGLMILAQAWINISGSLMSAAGRADMLAVGAFGTLISLGAACWFALATIGSDPYAVTLELALAMSLATILMCGPYLYFCFHFAGIDARAIFWKLVPAIGASLLMGLVVSLVGYAESFVPQAVVLVKQVVVGVVAYMLFARSEITWLWRQLRGLSADEDIHTVID
ncbi:lipopolysaccharide biosynthesis protein [Bremerella sp. JC817]|uniref:lipopolysaccharide biosynthesis protein n=1 Tax=Bremerella sp. JC817 TaxID=3231756 RepID=UPI00345844CF